ncbi:hypothetical protein CK203_076823 [Vitis vinifera]|uniref:DUF4283 domain-containing protein n=1 Tax=Vitis vinifera TaxID=29760 RepID=A0A438ESK9_VITVI|nr:hypothetical protein CK203_076823 [Vitis vinifera]
MGRFSEKLEIVVWFIGVDENTRRFSQLQWARILVKSEGKELSGTLQLVGDAACFAIQLWWEVLPRVFVVVPMNRSRGSVGMNFRADGANVSLTGSSVGREWELLHDEGDGLDCTIRKARDVDNGDSDGDELEKGGGAFDGVVGFRADRKGKGTAGGEAFCDRGLTGGKGPEPVKVGGWAKGSVAGQLQSGSWANPVVVQIGLWARIGARRGKMGLLDDREQCLMEEASRGAMVAVGKGHGVDGNLVARDGELTIDLLWVLLVEEEGNGLGVGGFSPTKKLNRRGFWENQLVLDEASNPIVERNQNVGNDHGVGRCLEWGVVNSRGVAPGGLWCSGTTECYDFRRWRWGFSQCLIASRTVRMVFVGALLGFIDPR